MKKIILIGGGGFCSSVIDVIIRQGIYEICGILERSDKHGQDICGFPICHCDDDMERLFKSGITNAAVTVGSVGDCAIRVRLYEQAKKIGFHFPVICDPSAVISKFAQLGEGCFISKNCVINPNTKVGDMAIINTGAIVEHSSHIGKFVSLSPGATISGGVIIGDYTHIGTKATVIQGVSIGSNTMIGAGSVVLKKIGDHKKAYGVPCKEVGTW